MCIDSVIPYTDFAYFSFNSQVAVDVSVYNDKGEECVQGKVFFFLAKPEMLRSVMGKAVDKYSSSAQ